ITAVKEGIIPGLGMWRIARHAGVGRAKRLALAAEVVDAATAHAWGLVDWVAAAQDYEAKVAEITERILSMAWTSTRLTKKLTNMAFDPPFDPLAQTYFEYQQQATTSAEHRHAMAEYRAARENRAAR